MIPGLALAAGVYISLSEVRYHTFLDQGLNYIPNVNPNPRFGWTYFGFNLKTMVWLLPKFDSVFPYMHPTFLGQGLLVTSPAFLLALRSKYWEMWVCAIIVAIPMLFVWANGYGQFGCRHFLPMFPFLMVMMGEREVGPVGKGLICVSIFLVTFGIFSVHEWGLTTPW